MTKTTTRALAASCVGLLCGLGPLVYVLIENERLRNSVRETVVAMNDPERLAALELAMREDRLATGLILVAILAVASINIWIGSRLVTRAERQCPLS